MMNEGERGPEYVQEWEFWLQPYLYFRQNPDWAELTLLADELMYSFCRISIEVRKPELDYFGQVDVISFGCKIPIVEKCDLMFRIPVKRMYNIRITYWGYNFVSKVKRPDIQLWSTLNLLRIITSSRTLIRPFL